MSLHQSSVKSKKIHSFPYVYQQWSAIIWLLHLVLFYPYSIWIRGSTVELSLHTSTKRYNCSTLVKYTLFFHTKFSFLDLLQLLPTRWDIIWEHQNIPFCDFVSHLNSSLYNRKITGLLSFLTLWKCFKVFIQAHIESKIWMCKISVWMNCLKLKLVLVSDD